MTGVGLTSDERERRKALQPGNLSKRGIQISPLWRSMGKALVPAGPSSRRATVQTESRPKTARACHRQALECLVAGARFVNWNQRPFKYFGCASPTGRHGIPVPSRRADGDEWPPCLGSPWT